MSINNKVFKIVLAEDDADDREFFQEVLEQLPVQVQLTIYKNGLELVNGLIENKENMPDLVFLDLNMPIMNGINALKEIRNIDVFKKIPIIAIYSTSISPVDQQDTFKHGADAYVTKPNDYKDLKIVLQKILQIDWDTWSKDKNNFIINP